MMTLSIPPVVILRWVPSVGIILLWVPAHIAPLFLGLLLKF